MLPLKSQICPQCSRHALPNPFIFRQIRDNKQLLLVVYNIYLILIFRCLQSVLPHIHLLWELALTNEVVQNFNFL